MLPLPDIAEGVVSVMEGVVVSVVGIADADSLFDQLVLHIVSVEM